MHKSLLLKAGLFLFVVLGIALLATLVLYEEDPCADVGQEITAAVLAEQGGDQDALTNTAILQRGRCEQKSRVKQEQKSDKDATPDAPGAAQPTAPDDASSQHSSGAFELLARAEAADTVGQASLAPPHDATEVLTRRCMVCHGCYDAPCQLKLEAHAGLVRGASKDLVYDGTRLVQANLTRLFDDADTEAEWRDKGFYPVLDKEDPGSGVLYRMLQLKQAHPLTSEGPVPEGFDFSLSREQQCPSAEEFDTFSRDYPLWGMPYGLPGLSSEEHTLLSDWIEAGAPAAALPPLTSQEEKLLQEWEVFLNGGTAKERLAARYIYEHLFLASLFLQQQDDTVWFRLVRSATPPGQAVQVLATRRPFDDPGVKQFYYRLQRLPVEPLAKIHMPYRFDGARLERYRELFIDRPYEVKRLPGYKVEVASNPFKAFHDIPVDSRYRFLLDEAQFSIMNFIKGPVCRGQVALNVIDDHFWVMFVKSDELDPGNNADFLARVTDHLRIPTPQTGTAIDLLTWRSYSKAHERYQKARSDYIESLVAADMVLEFEDIWDGDGHNDNATLTVFRHFDTATVVKGWVGDIPKTAWVIDYSLLERIHYLLVANFDVYGAVSHQLESRLYMDFLRMEGEFNFLLFLPPAVRQPLFDYWYRDARRGTLDHFLQRSALDAHTTSIEYRTDDPKRELLLRQKARIYGADAANWNIRRGGSARTVAAFEKIMANRGAHNSYLPQTSFINVIGNQADQFYTMLLDAAHSNIAQPFLENMRRLPDEDKVTIVHGFLGAYPNYFFQVNEREVDAFAEAIAKLGSEADFAALRERYGVRRNVSWFWRLSDKIHQRYEAQDPIDYGLFDYNRYRGD